MHNLLYAIQTAVGYMEMHIFVQVMVQRFRQSARVRQPARVSVPFAGVLLCRHRSAKVCIYVLSVIFWSACFSVLLLIPKSVLLLEPVSY